MRVIFVFLILSTILFGCKTNEVVSPSSSTVNPLSTIPSTIPGVYVGGYDAVNQIGYGTGKVWKNEDVLFSSSSTSTIKDIFISGNDVYAVGMIYDGKKTNATIWKNGVATTLGNSTTESYANGVFVLGNDVYVCGKQNNSAVIWKNGVASTLDANGELYTIFVSGSDVYASGNVGLYPNDGMSIFKNNNSIYFEKNGGFPTGMFVSGNDVYVSGYGNDNTGSQAKLWKNGTVTILDKVKTGGISSEDVFVSGNDVYVVGSKTLANIPGSNLNPSLAILWKNGIATNLSNGNTRAKAMSVYVSGSDVYVVGVDFISESSGFYTGSLGVIWKNGVPTVVSKTNNNLIPTSIFVVK
jgi:hypothetical protein